MLWFAIAFVIKYDLVFFGSATVRNRLLIIDNLCKKVKKILDVPYFSYIYFLFPVYFTHIFLPLFHMNKHDFLWYFLYRCIWSEMKNTRNPKDETKPQISEECIDVPYETTFTM